MADIRLKKITVEPSQAPLVIHKGNVHVTDTTSSTDSILGALIVNGGISIGATANATSASSGGGITVAGGLGISKNVVVGTDFTQDTSTGVFRVKGLSDDRFMVDSSLNKQITFRPDGVNTRFQITDTQLTVQATAASTSTSTGALNVLGGISIQSTVAATSVSAGGALTIGGGTGIIGGLHIGQGLTSMSSNTLGALITTTNGSIGVGTASPQYTTDIVGTLRSTVGITTGSLQANSIRVSSGIYSASDMFGVTGGAVLVLENQSTATGVVFRQSSSGNYTTISAQENTVQLMNYIVNGTVGTLRTDLVVNTAGNVGIGKVTPLFPVDINGALAADTITVGSVQIAGGLTAPNVIATSLTTGNINSTSIVVTNVNATTVTAANLRATAATIQNIQSTESSIGTLVTSQVVNTTGLSTGSLFTPSATIGALHSQTHNITTGVSTGYLIASDTATLANTSNTIGNVFTTGGNVGIGTPTPTATLDVVGSARITNPVSISSTQQSTFSSVGALVLTHGGLSITSTSDASSGTRGGALTVAGGTSIAKQVYIGGDTQFASTTPSTSSSQAAVKIAGGLSIAGNENVVNVGNGGALTVAGGASIGLDLWVGGQINGSGSSSSTFAYLTLTATDEAVNFTSGALVTFGGITVQCTTNATSVTNGGSFLVDGGGSIGGDFYVGQNTFVYGSSHYFAPTNDVINLYDSVALKSFSLNLDTSSKNLSIVRYDTNGLPLENTLTTAFATGITTFANTTASTSNASAALIINGGVSVNATANAISISNGGGLTVAGGQSISKDLRVGGNVILSSTTQSNNVSTGALLVAGGVGISKNLSVLGDATVNGNLTVAGAITAIETTNTVLADNIFLLNSGPVGSKDAGFMIQRFQQDNNTGTGDVVNDTLYLNNTLPLQTGMSSTEIKFSASASGVNGYYDGWWIKIASGFSSNQVRKITGYDGTTKVATVSSAWNTQNPAVGDVVYLYNKPYVGMIYNEIADRFEFGATVNDPNNASVTLLEAMPIQLSELRIVSTQGSLNGSTGSVMSYGGVTIASTIDATSVSAGGSFTTLGGASVEKSMYVGNSLQVAGVNLTPNAQDRFSTVSFTAANNQVSPATLTNMSFDSSVWGSDIYLAARVSATTPLYSNFHIRAVNKNTGWELVKSYVGDDTGIDFTMTTGGQVQYTSPNYPGFTSLIFKWRALVN